jgi:hypothetical protein
VSEKKRNLEIYVLCSFCHAVLGFFFDGGEKVEFRAFMATLNDSCWCRGDAKLI